MIALALVFGQFSPDVFENSAAFTKLEERDGITIRFRATTLQKTARFVEGGK